MIYRLSVLSATAALLMLAAGARLAAQSHPLPVPRDTAAICGLVRDFFAATVGKPVTAAMSSSFAVDGFVKTLDKQVGKLFWLPNMRGYEQRDVRSIRKNDSLVIVKYLLTADSLPYHGPLMIDWIFFLRRNDAGQWRISAVRRLAVIDKGIATLLTLDQSNDYPKSLKSVIAREIEPVLWSNEQMKENFRQHRPEFMQLTAQFNRKDSLVSLGRIDRRISQINRAAIDWGVAAQDVPQEAIDEYLQGADEGRRKEIQAQLRHAARLRKQGMDSLMKYIHRYRLNPKRLDSVVAVMREARVTFVTVKLPWKQSVQLTVAGSFDDAVGYLYSPNGELPLISTDEYFDLEEIGDGWWVFRAT